MKYYKVTTWSLKDPSTTETEMFEELGQAMVRVHSKTRELISHNEEPQYYRWRIDNENPVIGTGAFEEAYGRYDRVGNVLIVIMRTK